ncbi:PREDICTED: uncharacterized protein LOC109185383 isoform X1 [Ipomoea nil]|uniref:uncharacterized protein LOC109185383 isoform X1 n=2 Tax=Ipomoea nil TaxID=35883 RepID=UPI0009015F8A|nr:PREDICTED: uncharacterized protein LOC109185383 isoform X1 [Ipomoea nil]
MDPMIASLLTSFRLVPPEAIPAMLDCILASTASSPFSIFSTLLEEFPSIAKEKLQAGQNLELEQRNFIESYVGALCHILKKPGSDVNSMQLFIWEIFIPLMKLVQSYDRVLLNKVAGLFFGVVIETNSWEIVGSTIVPFLLRSIGLSMGMLQSKELSVYKWNVHIDNLGGQDPGLQSTQDASFKLRNAEMNNNTFLSESNYFQLPTSCYMLTLMLELVLGTLQSVGPTSKLNVADRDCAKMFAANLVWDLFNLTIEMLLQSLEHRSSAISFLLPSIFQAFDCHSAFEVSINGQKYVLSRNHILADLWKSCKALFSLGPLERRDAYSTLSLYLSFFSIARGSHGPEDASLNGKETMFDLRAQKEFWDEIKKGLVNKESFVRKQSLHTLKRTISLSVENQFHSSVDVLDERNSVPHGLTKRERWAENEAKSLGVGRICNSIVDSSSSTQKWEAFFLLYEMLEEYGTHLVEAAWNHQMTLLLHYSPSPESVLNGEPHHMCMDTLEETFDWLVVLWERGFCHDNPQVRCLIMQSFLGIEWRKYKCCAELISQNFIFGPLMEGLNDPVHHKDFGVKGVYSTWTIEAAAKFLCVYTSYLDQRVAFLISLASVAKTQSFGRAGLMCFVKCISSAASGDQKHSISDNDQENGVSAGVTEARFAQESSIDKADLLDVFRFVIESSRQHFNPTYRHQVCEEILDAAVSVMAPHDVPLETLLLFVASLPRELTDSGGSLRLKVQKWLQSFQMHFSSNSSDTNLQLLRTLICFPPKFISCHSMLHSFITYDDEDLDAWESEAKRWARVLFLVIKGEQDLDPIFMFIQEHGADICKEKTLLEWIPVKYLILILSLVYELQLIEDRVVECFTSGRLKMGLDSPGKAVDIPPAKDSRIFEKFTNSFCSLLQDSLVSFARLSCYIFDSRSIIDDSVLPGSIKGRLGGPSQRRLPSSTASSVLQAITAIKSVASISKWCIQFRKDASIDFAITYLWNACWKVITSSSSNSEIEAEISLAAYEAVGNALKEMAPMFSLVSLDLVKQNDGLSPSEADDRLILDSFFSTFLQNINSLIGAGTLVRSRRAVLLHCKWICLEALLSIPKFAFQNGVRLGNDNFYFSNDILRQAFNDLVDNLENGSEASVLPMLRSVRLLLELFVSGQRGLMVSSCAGISTKMMWRLVHSSWILHVSCNKRRVAPIAALLSSVLQYSMFSDESMHELDGAPGPLKWFVEKILEEGTKSPRTIRLAALHLTGLWLANPSIIKYYIKELQLLTLYGSVAFDEDFEAELSENQEAKCEVAVLAKSPDPELTEEFINTELYARVSVAVLFHRLADIACMAGLTRESNDGIAALASGKMFLLELINSVLTDKDLSKELYKKYSAIHRRKVRAWQMICILSRFVDQDIVQRVTHSLHTCLCKNNLPSVRQYLETFAIHIYLNFPSLVGEELVPIFRDSEMRPQALSSYVFIAANIILHSTGAAQPERLSELLPPIVPLLTSHHHTLRGFTQLLVYKVLQKLMPRHSSCSTTLPLEIRCFEDLKLYLMDNPDCARLRASMEGYLDAFDPQKAVMPAGIFSTRVEDLEFECVPATLMDRVITFLNDTREDLRSSMAKDAATIKKESLHMDGDVMCNEISEILSDKQPASLSNDISFDFQRKVTFSKLEMQGLTSNFSLDDKGSWKSLHDMEKEDQILGQVLHLRTVAFEKLKKSRQDIILVASLIDRIPNLAGLTRTCEVFRAGGLAIANKDVLKDKQFQLISVTAEKWVPILEVPVISMKAFLEKKKQEGFSILGLEQTANSMSLDQYVFPKKTVLVLGREKEGIPVNIIHILDACIEIPQLGIVRSLNVHVSGAIALWEYSRQQRCQ